MAAAPSSPRRSTSSRSDRTSALRDLHAWLDSWAGLGLVVVGMERHGYALSLNKVHGDGWRASSYRHPMTSADGFATAAAPWTAVQRAAWMPMKRAA